MSRFETWSRRKRGLDDTQSTETTDPPVSMPSEVTEAPAEGEKSEIAEASEIVEGSLDDQLPDPDTLGPGSDFKAYLLPGVSASLKRRALRRLYTTGNYNVRDGLDDYDHDYSQLKTLSASASERIRQWTKRVVDEFDDTDKTDTDKTTAEASARHEETREDKEPARQDPEADLTASSEADALSSKPEPDKV